MIGFGYADNSTANRNHTMKLDTLVNRPAMEAGGLAHTSDEARVIAAEIQSIA